MGWHIRFHDAPASFLLLVMCLFMYVVALTIMQGVATDVVEAVVAENQSCVRSLEMPHLGPSNAASPAVEALLEL